MLGLHRTSTDGFSRRLSALRDELDHLQSSFHKREREWGRMASDVASDAQDWVAERAESLPSLSLDSLRRHLPALPHRPFRSETSAVPVIVAAVAVGVGVGCVLYAVTSRGRRSARGPAREDERKAQPVVD
ncbi:MULTISPECIES: hypothetical protein [Xanthobacter]|nr:MULTISPECIES: hypothetical protein [Xanthobacter]MCL8381363.1 hypothetical protein [Xanthobacter aminoxidans]